MPMPELQSYGANYGNYSMNNSGLPEDYCLPLNPSTGAFVPRAYFIDQPYIGMLPFAQGMEKGTIFPNIILPEIS